MNCSNKLITVCWMNIKHNLSYKKIKIMARHSNVILFVGLNINRKILITFHVGINKYTQK